MLYYLPKVFISLILKLLNCQKKKQEYIKTKLQFLKALQEKICVLNNNHCSLYLYSPPPNFTILVLSLKLLNTFVGGQFLTLH